MSEWVEKELGEITSLVVKGIPPKYTDRPGDGIIRVLNQKCNRNGVISYSPSRFHDTTLRNVPEERMLRVNDVLINSTGEGTAGRVAQIKSIPEPTTIDGHMILLRPTNEILPRYYGYAIRIHQDEITALAEGSTGQTEINRSRLLREVSIRFPKSFDDQRRIASFFSAIDDKIALNEAINHNLSA